jgi:methionine-rich copper-binding protein CopC
MRRVSVLSAVLAMGIALAFAAPAAAHTALVSSTPQRGDSLSELTEVTLEFSGAVLDIGAEITLTGPGGSAELAPVFPGPGLVSAEVPADAVARPGDYVLVWRVVAEDGHPISDTIGFSIVAEGNAVTPSNTASPSQDASPGASPSVSPSASPSETGAEPEPSVTPSATIPSDPNAGVPRFVVWIVVALAVIAVAGAPLMKALRR